MTFLDVLILSLATWRVSNLLVNETGPGHLFVVIRELAGIQHDEAGSPVIVPDGFLPGVLSCVWCASMWVGSFWTLVLLLPFGAWLALPFALSAGAILADKFLNS